uniref:Photosynthesis system II assembly factor Ycf48/Hcf136-like domain-containing protein n=1 Tax=Ignavibacterium album TaxID=591197 RepID=A0A832G7R5_9BACT
MKINLIILLASLILIQACKDETLVEPLPQDEEDFWEFKDQPDKIIRKVKMCSNGYIVAETPGKILLSTDNGESWGIILSTNTAGAIGIGLSDEIYIAGNSDVWFSYDYGNSWNRSEISFTALDSTQVSTVIFGIEIDKDGSVYLGTMNGVFRSDDRGNNWKRLVNGMFIQDIRSLLINSNNKIFAGSNSSVNGIYVSTDKGENWQDVYMASMDGQIFFALAEDSLGNLYAGGIEKLLFSNDDGNTWEIISYVNSHFTDILLDKNNNLYTSFADGGMFLSKDGGSTWEEKSKGLKELVGIRSLLLDKNGFLFAGTDGIGIYKSKKSIY